MGLVDGVAETDYHACWWVAGGTAPFILATMDQIYRRYEEPGHLTIGEDWMTTSQQWRGPHPVSSGRVSPLPWAEWHVSGRDLLANRWMHHFLPVA